MILPYCYCNGQIIPSEKASVGINDLGLLRGYAIFDYLCTHQGKPFLINEHLDRFFNSAGNMFLPVPETKEKIKEIITELITKNNAMDAGIRLVLTGGNTPDGFNPGKPNFIITVESFSPVDPELFSKGVRLMTHEHLREFSRVKTNNYITAINLQKEKENRKAYDILYTHQGKILELVRSNFFMVKNNTLVTPRENILIGMTRNTLIQLAKDVFKVEERNLDYAELKTADEAFFTGTTKHVIPVVQVDDIKIGNGKPGPVTQRLKSILDEYVRTY